MTRRMLLMAVLAASAYLAPPPVAQASIVASYAGGVLTISSDDNGNVDETYALRDEGSTIAVQISPATASDPDAGGDVCTATAADEVRCARTQTSSVHVVAGNGNDTITDNRVQGPASVIEGGPGADTLKAGGARAFSSLDTGGPGDDTFVGNPDLPDYLVAEPGADTYTLGTRTPHPGDSTTDPVDLQRSFEDGVSYGGSQPVAVRLDGIANDGRSGEQDDVRADVERIFGTEAGDLLVAGPNPVGLSGFGGDDELIGGPGKDVLSGDGDDDVLRGGEGDDYLVDGDFTGEITTIPFSPAGDDVLDGGSGDDVLRSDRGADDLSGGPGFDRATFDRPIPQAPSVPTPALRVGFTISLDDVANDGQTGTGEGDDVHSDVEAIATSGGDDAITGSAGPDEISTGAGADVVDPQGGPDVVDLGTGDDRAAAVDEATDTIRCGAGSDSVVADLPGGQPTRADVLQDCEGVTGTPFPPPGPPQVDPPRVVPPQVDPPGVAPLSSGPAADTTRPVVTLSSKAITSKAFLANGRLDVTVSCSEACSARGKAYVKVSRVGRVSIGSGTLKLGTGKRTLPVTVDKKHRTRLRAKLRTAAQKRRGVRLSVDVTVKDAAGNAASASRTVTVKR